jgi:hypothetical protein
MNTWNVTAAPAGVAGAETETDAVPELVSASVAASECVPSKASAAVVATRATRAGAEQESHDAVLRPRREVLCALCAEKVFRAVVLLSLARLTAIASVEVIRVAIEICQRIQRLPAFAFQSDSQDA